MSGTVFARLAAAAFLLIAVVVAIIEMGQQEVEVRASQAVERSAQGASQSELQRCQTLGEAALEDRTCLDLWAEKRRRFLTTGEIE